jgi:hypothetical protein
MLSWQVLSVLSADKQRRVYGHDGSGDRNDNVPYGFECVVC